MEGGSSIVEQYWAGVQQRLDAEVSVFAELVRHEGEKGRENEAALGRILSSFVPQRYGVGSGLLIDSHNRYGRQTDLVVFDQSDEPAVLAQTTQLLFPIENVLASIEVKTTLRKAEIYDCVEKQRSMLELQPTRPYPDESRHPLFVVLAYNGGVSPEKTKEHFLEADPDIRPDLVCVLGLGMLIGTAPQLSATQDEADLPAGLALLTDPDGKHVTVKGKPQRRDMMHPHEGRLYPIVRHGDGSCLADRARALLLFAESLVSLLAEKQDRPGPALSGYITPSMRSLAPVR
jgi:hypothetical protein